MRKDGWFPVKDGKSSEPVGQLKVSLEIKELPIMPMEEYSSLKEVLISRDFQLCSLLGKLCTEDRSSFCNSLLAVLACDHNSHFALIKCEIEREVQDSNEPNTLFRGVTFCSTLINLLVRSAMAQYVSGVLGPVVGKIVEAKQTFEIDSTKLEASTNQSSAIHVNALQLVSLSDEVCRAIFTSAKDIPSSVRYVFSILKRKVAEKFPRDPNIKLRAIGSFLFLRLFCLALVDPRQFHIVTDVLPRHATRNLVLIAKVLQTLANLSSESSTFQGPNMEPLRNFVENMRTHMISYLNDVSASCPEPEPASKGVLLKNSAADLANLFHIAAKNLDLLQEKCIDASLLKSVVSVVELLQNHQNQYLLQSYSPSETNSASSSATN